MSFENVFQRNSRCFTHFSVRFKIVWSRKRALRAFQVTALAASPDGDEFYSASRDKSIKASAAWGVEHF